MSASYLEHLLVYCKKFLDVFMNKYSVTNEKSDKDGASVLDFW